MEPLAADLIPAAALLKKHAGQIPNYQPRPGQLQLTAAVQQRMAEGGQLIAEGECGTGKALAQLAPAFERAAHGERTIITTYTINLTEQLMQVEIPRLQVAMPNISVALLKGRRHYLCRYKLHRHDPWVEHDPSWPATADWIDTTEDGDMAASPASAKVRDQITISSGCLRRDCPSYSSCHYELARQRFRAADIGVTNMKMLYVCRSIEESMGEPALLGPAQHLLIDEADKLAQALREPQHLRESKLVRMANALIATVRQRAEQLVQPGMTEPALDAARARGCQLRDAAQRVSDQLLLATRQLFDHLDARSSFEDVIDVRVEQNPEYFERMADALHNIGLMMPAEDGEDTPAAYLLAKILDGSNVLAIRYENGTRAVETIAVKIHSQVQTTISGARTTVFSSASMSIAGSFAAFRDELGIAPAAQLSVKSPFNFAQRSAILFDTSMPNYDFRNSHPHERATADRLIKIIRAMNGGVLALFSSWRAAEAAHAAVSGAGLPLTLLLQPRSDSDESRSAVIDKFKADHDSCLFGVDSLWTGVDAPGQTLRAVVIDRFPCASPTDVVMMGFNRIYPGQAYPRYGSPLKARLFKQGVGRLIRSESDYGLVFVLDARRSDWRFRSYTRSLPPDMPIGEIDLTSNEMTEKLPRLLKRLSVAGVTACVSSV